MAAITAELSLDAAQFAAGLKRADASLKTFSARATTAGRTAQKGMFGGFGRAANEAGELLAGALTGRSPATLLHRHFDELGRVLGPALVGGLAAVGIGQQVAGAVKKSMEAETMAISMEVLIGDATKAKQTLADLRKMAAATPFEFPDLASATKTLLGFGVANEDVLGTLSTISDVAQGNSETLSRLALVYGQIASTGRLMGQDLLQLINAGFNPLTVIAAKTGESMIELKKRMEDGLVSFAEVQQAFVAVTSAGGRFYRMNERQSQTTSGLFSTLADAWGEVQMAFGAPLNDAIRPFLSEAIPMVASFQDEFAALGKSVAEALTNFSQGLKSLVENADWKNGILQGLMSMAKPVADVMGAEISLALARAANALVDLLRAGAALFGDDIAKGLRLMASGLLGLADSVMRSFQGVMLDMSSDPIFGKMARTTANSISESRGGLIDALDQFRPEIFFQKFAQSQGKVFAEGPLRAARDAARQAAVAGSQTERAAKMARRREEQAFLNFAELPAMTAAEQMKAAGLMSPAELFAQAAAAKAAAKPTGIAAAGQAATQGLGRPVGRLASAINLIMGRSANELIYDEAKKQTAQQEQMNKTLNNIDRNTRPRPGAPVAIGATFGRP